MVKKQEQQSITTPSDELAGASYIDKDDAMREYNNAVDEEQFDEYGEGQKVINAQEDKKVLKEKKDAVLDAAKTVESDTQETIEAMQKRLDVLKEKVGQHHQKMEGLKEALHVSDDMFGEYAKETKVIQQEAEGLKAILEVKAQEQAEVVMPSDEGGRDAVVQKELKRETTNAILDQDPVEMRRQSILYRISELGHQIKQEKARNDQGQNDRLLSHLRRQLEVQAKYLDEVDGDDAVGESNDLNVGKNDKDGEKIPALKEKEQSRSNDGFDVYKKDFSVRAQQKAEQKVVIDPKAVNPDQFIGIRQYMKDEGIETTSENMLAYAITSLEVQIDQEVDTLEINTAAKKQAAHIGSRILEKMKGLYSSPIEKYAKKNAMKKRRVDAEQSITSAQEQAVQRVTEMQGEKRERQATKENSARYTTVSEVEAGGSNVIEDDREDKVSQEESLKEREDAENTIVVLKSMYGFTDIELRQPLSTMNGVDLQKKLRKYNKDARTQIVNTDDQRKIDTDYQEHNGKTLQEYLLSVEKVRQEYTQI